MPFGEYLAALERWPLGWLAEVDPGHCQRCGSAGAVPVLIYSGSARAVPLCRPCRLWLRRPVSEMPWWRQLEPGGLAATVAPADE